jgi:hypothetical protein
MQGKVNKDLKVALVLLFDTQTEAAKEMKISDSRLSGFVRGKMTPFGPELKRMKLAVAKRWQSQFFPEAKVDQ